MPRRSWKGTKIKINQLLSNLFNKTGGTAILEADAQEAARNSQLVQMDYTSCEMDRPLKMVAYDDIQ